MLYAMLATDRADHLWLREKLREQHVAFLTDAGATVRAAGRTLGSDAGSANGSFMIVQANSLAEAQAFVDRDPFVVNGLYERIELRPWVWVLGAGKPVDG